MLLSNRIDSFSIPRTSTCIIHTTGPIRNGDIVEVSSPIFSSVNFSSKAINTRDSFKVVVHTESGKVINNDSNGNELRGILICNDNDIFNMYVKL